MGHPPDEHIEPEVAHQLSIEVISEASSCCKCGPEKRDSRFVPISPTELFEVHGAHLHALLLARYEDACGVLANRDERPRLDIVVAPILHECLYRLSGKRTQLDLIEDYERRALVELRLVAQLKLQEQVVEVGHVIKETSNVKRRLCKVNADVAAVLLLGELLYDG